MALFYVPAFVDSRGAHLGEEADGAVVRSTPGPLYLAVTYDAVEVRFVVDTPNGNERPGWDEKTEEEVDADYPGIRHGA